MATVKSLAGQIVNNKNEVKRWCDSDKCLDNFSRMSENNERKLSGDSVLTETVPIPLQIFLWKQVR